jgi:cation transport regulator ChaC
VGPESVIWYFAYGSNMQSATFRGRRGIEHRRALAAVVEGWRVVFDKPPLLPMGQSFANLVLEPGAKAYGVLYEITPEDLSHVEVSEAVPLGNYRRVDVPARSLVSDVGRVLAVSLSSDRRDPELRPSIRYMAMVVEGALEHGLPAEVIEWLRSIPADEETEEARRARSLIDTAIRRR